MTYPHEEAVSARSRTSPAGHHTGLRLVLALTFICILAAVCVSVGLVVYTAWHHDLKNGLFALVFAVLSTRALLSWFLWCEDEEDPVGSK